MNNNNNRSRVRTYGWEPGLLLLVVVDIRPETVSSGPRFHKNILN